MFNSGGNKSDIHKSYHASGDVNYDYSGKSGTQHEHPGGTRWENNPVANGETLYKDSEGVWRYKDGRVFNGREENGK